MEFIPIHLEFIHESGAFTLPFQRIEVDDIDGKYFLSIFLGISFDDKFDMELKHISIHKGTRIDIESGEPTELIINTELQSAVFEAIRMI